MATTENEYYLRTILLLAEGGSYISKKILYRELSGDLSTLLKTFEHKLKRELHEKQIEKLFPRNGNTDVDTWDLQMLIIIILRLFHNSLKHEDKNNLRVIKMLRHEVQAHSPSAKLDDVQYDNIKDQLTDALTTLASGFEENVQKECRSFINQYTCGPLDVMSARECLKELQNNDVLFKQVLEKVENSKTDICTHLNASQKSLSADISQQMTDLQKNLIDQLQKLDPGTCRKKIKVGMHVELSLGGPTEEWTQLMEKTLNDVFNEAYKTSGGKFEEMKKRVEELLDDIKRNTTISFKGSKMKCIILMFECLTYSGLLDLLQYVRSRKYQRRLQAVTEALSMHFKVTVPVTVTSTISPASLQNAIDSLSEHNEGQRVDDISERSEFKRSLKLAMQCSSVNDLVYLWKMYQQDGAAHYLDRIAGVLSEYSGQKITLSSSIDLEEFKEALEDSVSSHDVADAHRETSKQTGLADAGDIFGKSNATLFCFESKEKTGNKSIQRIEKLEEIFQVEDENIKKVYVYKFSLTSFSLFDFFLYHMLVVFETNKGWWSIERSLDGVTIQRSTSVETILERYRNTTRTYRRTLEKSTRGHSSVIKLLYWLHRTGELNKHYNILVNNCTTFANVVFDYVQKQMFFEDHTKSLIARAAQSSMEQTKVQIARATKTSKEQSKVQMAHASSA